MKYSGCLLLKLNNSLVRKYNRATVYKFDSTITAFSAFLLHHYQKNDIILDKVRLKHLLEYEEYAAMVLKHKTATINKTIQRLKQIIKYAIGHDYLDKDPWTMHKSKSVQHLIVYLSKEQLDLLLQARMSSQTLEKVKDCFGICMQRQKTKKSFLIPIVTPCFYYLEKV
ncbi:MAG: phage integrase SAM-like domain-containing protein [Saprospiraceae bacterium]|nr:phage integrase SAM-like domain-containing protein [Saprospiraceae bacterium]